MQLNELLEENSVATISQKTKISEENIEHLLKNDFVALKKVNALGFISILEREYGIDLDKLREDAIAHYAQTEEVESVTLGLPIMEEKRMGSKWWLWPVILILLGYVSWYFFTQFDQSQLKSLLPFNEAKTVESAVPETENTEDEALNIKQVIPAPQDENNSELPASENE